MTFEQYDYTIPAYFAPAIIVNDYSGLDDDDKQKLNQFFNSVEQKMKNTYGKCNGHWDCDDIEYFSWSNDINDLGCNVIDFRWLQRID